MSTNEDENRLIRVVVPVRDINILIRHWSKERDAAAKQHDEAGVVRAMTSFHALQDTRASHGLEPLEIEGKKPAKAKPLPNNGQPDEGDE